MILVETFNRFLKGGSQRNVLVKKNIIRSFGIRAISIAINFSIVPLTINYVNEVQYGIWLTLASIISWFSFFDFGMGNGMRNQLATALAFKDYDKAKKYISTTYAVFILIALPVFILFYFVNPYINWHQFLNIPKAVTDDIHLILLIVLGSFCIQFVVQLINTVLTAFQEPAKAEFLTLLGQVVLLITLVILKFTVPGSLHTLIIALNVAPMVVILLASLVLYTGRLKFIAPSWKSVDFSYAKSILNLGGPFFVIQIGALVLFQTDHIIISRILGPEAVTQFNVTHKLYSIIIMGFSIIVNPYWSAFTDAYAKKDFTWISSSVKRLREVWLFISFIVVPVFFLLSKFVFKLWLPDTVVIPSSLSILMAGYVICYTCLALNCYFLNGIGKLKVQLTLYILVTITNVPLGFALGRLWGIEGVIIANIIAFIFMNIILWIQTNKIVQHKARGIWNA